jgi:hypothetical protein
VRRSRASLSTGPLTMTVVAKHSFEKTWPRWAGTVADLEKLAREASALVPEGTLQIEVHRRGLGTSEFATGSELAQALTIPDLARVDRVTVRVDRPKAHDISLVAVSFTGKTPAVTIEAKGSNQELVSGALSRLSRAVEGGVLFPRSYPNLWLAVGIPMFVIAAAAFDALAIPLLSGQSLTAAEAAAEASKPSGPGAIFAILILANLLTGYGVTWLLTPLELLPTGSTPRLKRLWVVWVVPLTITLLGAAAWSIWPTLKVP